MRETPRGWKISKYENRKIIPTEKYPGYSSEVKLYIDQLAEKLIIGSDTKGIALAIAGSIYWEKARPSTLSACCILISIGSPLLKENITNVSKIARKMESTLIKWSEYLWNEVLI